MQLSISASQIAEDRKHKVCRPLADQCKSKRHVSQGLDFAQPGSSFVVEEGCGSGQRLRFVFDAKQYTMVSRLRRFPCGSTIVVSYSTPSTFVSPPSIHPACVSGGVTHSSPLKVFIFRCYAPLRKCQAGVVAVPNAASNS